MSTFRAFSVLFFINNISSHNNSITVITITCHKQLIYYIIMPSVPATDFHEKPAVQQLGSATNLPFPPARRTVGRLPAGLLSLTLPRVTPLPRAVFLPLPPFFALFPQLDSPNSCLSSDLSYTNTNRLILHITYCFSINKHTALV